MTHSPSIEDLLNVVLGEAAFSTKRNSEGTAQDLTEADKATLRTMVQTLAGDVQAELHTDPQSPNESTAQPLPT
ncbi:hypothetical protein [Leptolyngbya sp. GGD]|uniref:hypothetical protein n=1 Tax=Leptolyngbya sp. GGD TaxID=2997907 RepID=UPI00227B39A7|nr:hypothetical protein [Leptolyngbya sp. GGD]MCY6493376.1 hypothetical protein [Leptolyngbya sp. GGD]